DALDLPRLRGDAGGALGLRAVRRLGLAPRRRPLGAARSADRGPAGGRQWPRLPGLGEPRGAGPRAGRGARQPRARVLPRAGPLERDALGDPVERAGPPALRAARVQRAARLRRARVGAAARGDRAQRVSLATLLLAAALAAPGGV